MPIDDAGSPQAEAARFLDAALAPHAKECADRLMEMARNGSATTLYHLLKSRDPYTRREAEAILYRTIRSREAVPLPEVQGSTSPNIESPHIGQEV